MISGSCINPGANKVPDMLSHNPLPDVSVQPHTAYKTLGMDWWLVWKLLMPVYGTVSWKATPNKRNSIIGIGRILLLGFMTL